MSLTDWMREIREVNAVEANTVGFLPVCIVKHPMPRREQNSDFWHCQNGAESLRVIPGLTCNLPYGYYGRLVLADMTSNLLCSKSTSWILRDNPTAYTRSLGKSPSGGPNGTLPVVRHQVCALTESKFLYGDTRFSNSCHKVKEFRVTDDRPWMPNESRDWNGTLTFNPDFCDWVTKSAMPFDLRVLKGFHKKLTSFDLYCLLAHRYVSMAERGKSEERISFNLLYKLFAAPEERPGVFTKRIKKALFNVSKVYPHARYYWNEYENKGITLEASPPHVPYECTKE